MPKLSIKGDGTIVFYTDKNQLQIVHPFVDGVDDKRVKDMNKFRLSLSRVSNFDKSLSHPCSTAVDLNENDYQKASDILKASKTMKEAVQKMVDNLGLELTHGMKIENILD